MNKIDWKNHIIEFITVVIGIWLAFALNSWSDHKKEIKQANLFLNSIKEEMKINLEEVENKYEYHTELLENLKTKPSETNLIIRSARLEDHAWEMANNNIFKQHTDFEIYKKLSKIYSIQEVLTVHNSQAGQMMTQLSVNGPYMMLPLFEKEMSQDDEIAFRAMRRQGWIPVFEDMIYFESLLIEQYKAALEEIN